jgi:hypothetical protein
MNDNTRPCCMTILMNDYAYPKEREYILPLLYIERPLSARQVSIYSHMTMETLRTLSNEEIGKFVRKLLDKLDEDKQRIEG